MKTKLFCIVVLLGFVLAFGQKTYVLKNNLTLTKKEMAKKDAIEGEGQLSKNNLIYIYNKSYNSEKLDTIYQIATLPFKDSVINKEKFSTTDNKIDPNIIYEISKKDFEKNVVKHVSRLGFGTTILPLKIRFAGGSEAKGNKRYFDFETNLNLGLSLTWRFRKSDADDVNFYGLFNLSTSMVSVDKETTNGYIQDATNVGALSPSLGILANFNNNSLQIIGVIEVDYLKGKIGTEWVYRDKLYIGFGIGFDIFKFNNKPTEQ